MVFDLRSIIFSVGFIEEQNMRPKISPANFTFIVFCSWIILLEMMLVAANLFAVSVNIVVLVLVFLGLNVEIIDILGRHCDLFA